MILFYSFYRRGTHLLLESSPRDIFIVKNLRKIPGNPKKVVNILNGNSNIRVSITYCWCTKEQWNYIFESPNDEELKERLYYIGVEKIQWAKIIKD